MVKEDLAELKGLVARPSAVLVKTGSAAGVWEWEAGSSTTPDDGIVVQCTAGAVGRYKRLLDDVILAQWYPGGAPDGLTNNTAAVTAAVTAASTYDKVLDLGGPGNIWLVNNIDLNGTSVVGIGAKVKPATSAADYSVRLVGYGASLNGIVFDDEERRVIKSTTLAVSATGGATQLELDDGSTFKEDQLLMVLLDTGEPFASMIASKASTNVVNLTTALPSGITAGRKVDASFAQVYSSNGYAWSITNCKWINGSACLLAAAATTSDPAAQSSVENCRFDFFSHFAHASAKDQSEITFSNIFARGGVVEVTAGTFNGVSDTVDIPTEVWLKRNLVLVTVNGTPLTYGGGAGEFEVTANTADGATVTFGTTYSNGTPYSISNYREAMFGRWTDGTGFTNIYGGNRYSQCVYISCRVGSCFNHTELLENSGATNDTCSYYGTWIRNSTGNAEWFSGNIDNYSQVPMRIEASPSISIGGLTHTQVNPAGSATLKSPSAYGIMIDAASNGAMFDTFGWTNGSTRVIDNPQYFRDLTAAVGLSATRGITVTSTDTGRANFASITAADASAGAPSSFAGNAYTVLAGPALGGNGNLAASYNAGASTAYLSALMPGVAWRTLRLNLLRLDVAPSNSLAATIDSIGVTVQAGAVFKNTAVNVSALPAPGTVGPGARHFVGDANATTFGSVVAGGGSSAVPVYSDGTDWRIG